MKKRIPTGPTNQNANADLTIRVGRDAKTGRIWMSQQLGATADRPTYLSLVKLSMMALELEVMGDDEAAEFVRGMVDRIEKASISETIEASYCFPVLGKVAKTGPF